MILFFPKRTLCKPKEFREPTGYMYQTKIEEGPKLTRVEGKLYEFEMVERKGRRYWNLVLIFFFFFNKSNCV